eukprot:GSA25T00016855001.1
MLRRDHLREFGRILTDADIERRCEQVRAKANSSLPPANADAPDATSGVDNFYVVPRMSTQGACQRMAAATPGQESLGSDPGSSASHATRSSGSNNAFS